MAPVPQGSATQVIEGDTTTSTSAGTLRLQARRESLGRRRRPPKPRRQVAWDETVIDNEHLDRKRSKRKYIEFIYKVCCIYHKQRAFGESSDESECDSSSSEEGDVENGTAKESNTAKGKQKSNQHHHPNAYERQPVYKKAKS